MSGLGDDDFPPRLLDDPASGLTVREEEVLRAAHSDSIDGVRAFRVMAATMGVITSLQAASLARAASTTSTITTKVVGHSLLLKMMLGTVVVGSAVAWWTMRGPHAGSVDRAPPATTATIARSTGTTVSTSTATANAPPGLDDLRLPPRVSVARPTAAVAPSPSEPPPVAPAAAKEPASGAPRADRPQTPPSSLDPQLALLRLAHARMREGDPSSAVRELDRFRTEFPDGALAPEAEAMAIDALVAAGRNAEAKTRAERFLALRGDQPQVARIRKIRERLP